MLIKQKELSEIYFIKHFNDTNDQFVDYEKEILTSSLSSFMLNNDTLNDFIKNIQPLVSLMFDQMNIMKNFQNYIVDKYYYQQNG